MTLLCISAFLEWHQHICLLLNHYLCDYEVSLNSFSYKTKILFSAFASTSAPHCNIAPSFSDVEDSNPIPSCHTEMYPKLVFNLSSFLKSFHTLICFIMSKFTFLPFYSLIFFNFLTPIIPHFSPIWLNAFFCIKYLCECTYTYKIINL